MSWFSGSITGTNENPVVSASKGEFFVPEDSGKGGHALKRLLLVCAVIAIALGIWYAAGDIAYMKSMPPEFEKLSPHLGATMPDVKWRTKGIKYADVPFELELREAEGKLAAMEYTATVAVGAEGVFSVANTLLGRYGTPGMFNDMALTVLKEGDLQALAEGESLAWTWELGHTVDYDSENDPHEHIYLDLRVTALPGEENYRIYMYAESRPEGTLIYGDIQ